MIGHPQEDEQLQLKALCPTSLILSMMFSFTWMRASSVHERIKKVLRCILGLH